MARAEITALADSSITITTMVPLNGMLRPTAPVDRSMYLLTGPADLRADKLILMLPYNAYVADKVEPATTTLDPAVSGTLR